MTYQDNERACLEYFTQSNQSFWQLDSDEDAVLLKDGRTLTFLDELRTVLERLGHATPPPFPAILLVIAATRSDQSLTDADWQSVCSYTPIYSSSVGSYQHQDLSWESVREGLNMLGRLPNALKKSAQAKAEIIYILTQRTRPTANVPRASSIAEYLNLTGLHAVGAQQVTPLGTVLDTFLTTPQGRDVADSLRFLHESFKSLDVDTLVHLLRTGLEEPPDAIEFDIPFHMRVRSFLASIAEDEALGGVSRLATELMAAVRLPQPLSKSQELPIGGVSDITNRGTIDRLLTSELAYDDLTLATRLAMNEALYFRRETPPQNPARHRHVLLDAGLRMWGVPRMLATSVALALSATTDHGATTDVYASQGQRFFEIDLLCREGLASHLERLTADLHFGEAVPSFLENCNGLEGDVVLVTSADTIADRDFEITLNAVISDHAYVVAVDRTGGLALYSYSVTARKLIRHSNVCLDTLFARPKRSKHVAGEQDARPPAMLLAEEFPILLPCHKQGALTWTVHVGNGVEIGFQLSHDGRLMQILDADRGGRQVSDELAGQKRVHAAETTLDSDGLFRVVMGPKSRYRVFIVTIDIRKRKASAVQVPIPESFRENGISIHRGTMFALTSSHAIAFDLRTGERLGQAVLSSRVVAHQSRFLLHRDPTRGMECFATAWNGSNIEFVKMTIDPKACQEIVALFDRPGREGPAAFLKDGAIYSFEITKCLDWPAPNASSKTSAACVSFDGRHIACAQSGGIVVHDLEKQTTTSTYHRPLPNAAYAHVLDKVPPKNLRVKFGAAAIDNEGKLVLLHTKGTAVTIEFDPESRGLHFEPASKWNKETKTSFQPFRFPRPVGFKFSLARWADGSLMWLDSRGLLHCRSSDSRLPEFSLVLAGLTPISGWLDDGQIFGDSYFVGHGARLTTEVFVKDVYEPFLERLG